MTRRWLWLILVLALGLRIGNAVLLPWQGDEMVISDMQAYDRAAVAWLKAEPLGVHTAERYLFHPLGSDTYHPPGYYYFLGAVYAVAGHRYWVVRLVQAVLDTGTCLLLYHLGRGVAGETEGVLAAALAAVYPPFVLYTGFLLTETLSTFLLVAAALLVLRFAEQDGPCPWVSLAVAGIFLGLAGLTRSILLVMAPVMLLWLILFRRRGHGWIAVARLGLTFGLPVVFIVAPVTVRNYQLHHRLILVSTNGGVNFFLGHGGTERMKLQIRNVPENPTPGQLIGISSRTAPEEEAYFYQLGWQYIREVPLRTLRRLPGKLREMYWSSSFWPATDAQLRIVEAVDRVLWRALIVPLCAVSLLLLRALTLRRALLLHGLGVASLIMPTVFWAQPRFRIPFVPFAMVLATASAVAVFRAAQKRRFWETRSR